MKRMVKILSVVAVVGVIGLIAACTPQQQQAVARQLGVAAAVTWIGIDNPSTEDIAAVTGVVAVIESVCGTNTIESYYESVYPLVDEYITEKVKPNQQPMARLGASFVLTSLDTAFAMNPSWKTNVGTASSMVRAFCQGVNTGLRMSPSNPVMVAARRGIPVRAVSGHKSR